MDSLRVAPSPIHGSGVFAADVFEAGESLLALDDSRVVDAAHPLRPEAGELPAHCDYLARGLVVLMREPERYINHCCDPNTYVQTIDGTRHVIALRRIAPGEEITYDYSINGYGDTRWT